MEGERVVLAGTRFLGFVVKPALVGPNRKDAWRASFEGY
jgi:hypothetical protein